MRKVLLFIVANVLIAACSSDEMNKVSSESKFVKGINVTIEDAQYDLTRSSYTVDESSGFLMSWIKGDTIGIYPIGADQVAFPISSGDGNSTAKFDGGAWSLRASRQYAAYYPFRRANYNNKETAIPVSYTGQTQNGNTPMNHLATYDYMAASAVSPTTNGNVDITLKHLGAFMRLQLTMPVADTYRSLTLTSSNTPFVTDGTFNLKASTPTITPTKTSDVFTMTLKNVETTSANQTINIYAMVAPTDLSGSNITITVTSKDEATYVATISGKNMQAGYAYNYEKTLDIGTRAMGEIDGHEYVVIGGVKWATMNLGATTVAGSPSTAYGNYYAWGETTAYGETKTDYYWSTYKYCNKKPNDLKITKYCINIEHSSQNYPDKKTILEAMDDAAYQNWGSNWHMPTIADFIALYNACGGDYNNSSSMTPTTLSGQVKKGGIYWLSADQTYESAYTGVSGILFVSKSDIFYRVFFPVAGYTYYSSNNTILKGVGITGSYYSSLLTATNNQLARRILLHNSNNGVNINSYSNRYEACSIRPVAK